MFKMNFMVFISIVLSEYRFKDSALYEIDSDCVYRSVCPAVRPLTAMTTCQTARQRHINSPRTC